MAIISTIWFNEDFKTLKLRPLHDRGAKEKCAKILLIEAGSAVNI